MDALKNCIGPLPCTLNYKRAASGERQSPRKIPTSIGDMVHIAHRHLCTDLDKIKREMPATEAISEVPIV